MRKLYLAKALTLLCLIFATGSVFAQCPNTNTLYNITLQTNGAGTSASNTFIYGGEYVLVSVCNGATYSFSSAGTTYDTQITLYNNANGAYLAYNDDEAPGSITTSYLTWTSTFTGTVRLLLNEYSCLSNSIFSTVVVTQLTGCGGACTVSSLTGVDAGCEDSGSGLGTLPTIDFTFYFTGGCTVQNLYISENGGAYAALNLSAYALTNGVPIHITDFNTFSNYNFYYTLSNGASSGVYTYTTGGCDVCFPTDLVATDGGCVVGNTGAIAPSVYLTPYFTGSCTVAGVYLSVNGGAYQYIDVSAFAFASGEAIQIVDLLQSSSYSFYYVLSDGSSSPTEFFFTPTCATCSPVSFGATDAGCQNYGLGLLPTADIAFYYTGTCTPQTLYYSINGGVYQTLDLSGFALTNGEILNLYNLQPNSNYTLYYVMSTGATSSLYSYQTGSCFTGCTNLSISHTDNGCITSGTTQVNSGTINAIYSGACTVQGIYTSVNGGAYEYLDLSAFGYTSGSQMGLLFNIANANYAVYYVLSDGSNSPVTTFTTTACESGVTICDCAGTQLPIEALAWHGDGDLDNGNTFWNGVPVNFNCATWGFDCGDEMPVGTYPYDPYGTCSGALPPANGCVDEFCYNIDLDVLTDCYPGETGIRVFNDQGALVFEVPAGDMINQYTQYTYTVCLPAGCYTFQVYDTFGDGMNNGNCTSQGAFGVWDYTTNSYVINISGSAYTFSSQQVYCVGPQTTCSNLEAEITQAPCFSQNGAAILPSIFVDFTYSGPCLVDVLYLSENGAAFQAIDLSAQAYQSGDQTQIVNLNPNSSYQIYYTTNDGATSFLYNYATADCNNEVTICDCAGTQHTIGVTAWLADGFADNGTYSWDGQNVNFNCAAWSFDCGDIAGAPSVDPYGVCDGGLPPFNGCSNTAGVFGCTDPTALNYNAQATINDGSCIYNLQIGCTDPVACNYNELAVVDNGSCEYATCSGCTDPDANNYDESATIDDGSCDYTQIAGCMDSNALNYNPLATVSDGSCIFACVWPTVVFDSHCTQGDLNNFYVDVEVTSLGNGAPYTITNSFNQQQLVLNLAGSFTMGPFPNNVQVVIYVTSFVQACSLTSPVQSTNCNVVGVYGCTDPAAINYNPAATIDDGSCVFTNVEEQDKSHFAVYPNPANEKLTISSTGVNGFTELRIMDNAGRVVKVEKVQLGNGSQFVMNLQDLASGNYTLQLTSNEGVEHHSIVVQH